MVKHLLKMTVNMIHFNHFLPKEHSILNYVIIPPSRYYDAGCTCDFPFHWCGGNSVHWGPHAAEVQTPDTTGWLLLVDHQLQRNHHHQGPFSMNTREQIHEAGVHLCVYAPSQFCCIFSREPRAYLKAPPGVIVEAVAAILIFPATALICGTRRAENTSTPQSVFIR